MSLLINISCLIIAVILGAGNCFAEQVRFAVVSVDGGQVLLRGADYCAPGTQINLGGRADGKGVVTLTITSHRRDGLYVAVGSMPRDNVSDLGAGDEGVTNSPQFFHRTMEVAISNGNAAMAGLARILPASEVRLVSEEDSNADTTRIEVAGTIRNPRYTIRSEFDNESERYSSLQELGERIRLDSYSFFWVSLQNPLVDLEARFPGQRIIPINSADFNPDGSLNVGKPIALQVLPPIGGYLSILMVESGGRVTVLFPNNQPGAKWGEQAPPSVPWDFNNKARLDLTASAPGPTVFVVLVSATPRPLSAFMPANLKGSFFASDGETPVDPKTIGPGWLNRASPDVENVEDFPETWAAYHIVLNVLDTKRAGSQ